MLQSNTPEWSRQGQLSTQTNTIQIQIQIPLFSIKHNTMFLAYIGKYTYNENMKKDVHICVI